MDDLKSQPQGLRAHLGLMIGLAILVVTLALPPPSGISVDDSAIAMIAALALFLTPSGMER